MMELFADKTKYTKLNVDPTLTQLTTLQNYLRIIYNRGEITNDVYSEVQPQSTQPARAHGLPKIHKDFDNLPPFRPIIDTTGTDFFRHAKKAETVRIYNSTTPYDRHYFLIQQHYTQPRNSGSLPTHGAAKKTLVGASHVILSKIYYCMGWGKYQITCFHIQVVHLKCKERDLIGMNGDKNFLI